MTEQCADPIRDVQGCPWEKRGGAVWLCCPACAAWFPAAGAMLALGAPACCCPGCHHEFRPGPCRPGAAP